CNLNPEAPFLYQRTGNVRALSTVSRHKERQFPNRRFSRSATRKAPLLDCAFETPHSPPLSCRSKNASPARTETSLNLIASLSANALHKPVRRVPDLFGHVCLGRDKLRREPGKQPNQIVRHKDLPIAVFP